MCNTDTWKTEINLKLSDQEAIETNLELNDRCMDAISRLLREQFPNMEMIQSTLVVDNKDHCQHVGCQCDIVQIIHQKSRHHWIVSAVKDGEVCIYDSMQSASPLPQQTKTVLQNLYGDVIEYITTDVTQQTGIVDWFICHSICYCNWFRSSKLQARSAADEETSHSMRQVNLLYFQQQRKGNVNL